MRTSALRMRTRALPACGMAVGALALLTSTATGCTVSPQPQPEPTGTDVPIGAEESRRLVQDYLDAMVAKDLDKGRAQLCAATQEIFDASATGPNGDFAESLMVERAEIVAGRPVPVGHEVTATVTAAVGSTTLRAGAETIRVSLVFTVTPAGSGDGGWCIHDETATPDQPGDAGPADADVDAAPAGAPGAAPAGGSGAAPPV
ncbi:nuclear transport factor 2 family protein [Micromonospora sp. LOL_021]|uniref:nuclear transport factor 2 family protein n=1 Tax=Micromonospora sp. LOL_021 TaxID=3345417 RepID=UPI003A85C207